MNHQIIFLSNQVSPEQRHTTCLGVHPGTALTRMRKYELLRAHSLASRVKGSTIICYPSRAVTAVGKKQVLSWPSAQLHIYDCGGERCADDQHFGRYHNDWGTGSSYQAHLEEGHARGKPMRLKALDRVSNLVRSLCHRELR
jgi:hypothetical protein